MQRCCLIATQPDCRGFSFSRRRHGDEIRPSLRARPQGATSPDSQDAYKRKTPNSVITKKRSDCGNLHPWPLKTLYFLRMPPPCPAKHGSLAFYINHLSFIILKGAYTKSISISPELVRRGGRVWRQSRIIQIPNYYSSR